MKLKKKLLAGLMALTITFSAISPAAVAVIKIDTNIAYASDSIQLQKEELSKAIKDADRIRKTESYRNASSEAKLAYENAIKSGNNFLSNSAASGIELANATKVISQTRDDLYKSANDIYSGKKSKQEKINQLNEAISQNEVVVGAAVYLAKNNPKSTANFRQELVSLLKQSQDLVKKAKLMIEKIKNS